VVAKSCPEKIGAARQGNFGVRELEVNIGGLGLNKYLFKLQVFLPKLQIG
jgi:hypothetical protein